MKTSSLLIGLGIGVVIGAAIGAYLASSDEDKTRLAEEIKSKANAAKQKVSDVISQLETQAQPA